MPQETGATSGSVSGLQQEGSHRLSHTQRDRQLGFEHLFHGCHDPRTSTFLYTLLVLRSSQVIGGEGYAIREGMSGSRVGSENDDRMFEIDNLPTRVGEATLFE